MTDIRIYGTKTCPPCRALKQYLDEKGVKYIYTDLLEVSHDRKEKILAEAGVRKVPIVKIDGEYIIGFDKAAIDKLLK